MPVKQNKNRISEKFGRKIKPSKNFGLEKWISALTGITKSFGFKLGIMAMVLSVAVILVLTNMSAVRALASEVARTETAVKSVAFVKNAALRIGLDFSSENNSAFGIQNSEFADVPTNASTFYGANENEAQVVETNNNQGEWIPAFAGMTDAVKAMAADFGEIVKQGAEVAISGIVNGINGVTQGITTGAKLAMNGVKTGAEKVNKVFVLAKNSTIKNSDSLFKTFAADIKKLAKNPFVNWQNDALLYFSAINKTSKKSIEVLSVLNSQIENSAEKSALVFRKGLSATIKIPILAVEKSGKFFKTLAKETRDLAFNGAVFAKRVFNPANAVSKILSVGAAMERPISRLENKLGYFVLYNGSAMENGLQTAKNGVIFAVKSPKIAVEKAGESGKTIVFRAGKWGNLLADSGEKSVKNFAINFGKTAKSIVLEIPETIGDAVKRVVSGIKNTALAGVEKIKNGFNYVDETVGPAIMVRAEKTFDGATSKTSVALKKSALALASAPKKVAAVATNSAEEAVIATTIFCGEVKNTALNNLEAAKNIILNWLGIGGENKIIVEETAVEETATEVESKTQQAETAKSESPATTAKTTTVVVKETTKPVTATEIKETIENAALILKNYLTVKSGLAVGGNLTISGNLKGEQKLKITGPVSVQEGDVAVGKVLIRQSGDLYIPGTLTSDGVAKFTGEVDFTGATVKGLPSTTTVVNSSPIMYTISGSTPSVGSTIGGTFGGVTYDFSTGRDLTVGEDASIQGTLYVKGSSDLGSVSIRGSLSLEGAITMTSTATSTFANGIQLTSGCYLMPDGTCAGSGGSGANTALSNLVSVAINESLVSDTADTYNLGSGDIPWKDIYASGTAYLGSASTTMIEPWADNAYDLGSTVSAWKDIYASGTLTIGNSDNSATVLGDGYLRIRGTSANASGTLYLDNDGNVYTSGTIYIYNTGAMVIPVGETGDRPSSPGTGSLRYNTTTSGFEGYNGVAWSGLGGVIDVDQDTYILSELTSGSDDDTLYFFTGGLERMIVDSVGLTAGNGSASSTFAQDFLRLNANETTYASGTLYFDNDGSVYASGTIYGYGTATNTFAGGIEATHLYSTAGLTIVGEVVLPNDSITDAMLVDTITASNYLPLSGGTITGTLGVDGLFTPTGGIATSTIDNIIIGGSTPLAGYFTGLDSNFLRINASTNNASGTLYLDNDGNVYSSGTIYAGSGDLHISGKIYGSHGVGDTDTYIDISSNDQMSFYAGGLQIFQLDEGSVDEFVINQQSGNIDTRIESDNDAELFYLDASTDRIGLSTRSPGAMLDIFGGELFVTASDDTATSTFGNNYLRLNASATNASGTLYFDNDGSVYTSGTIYLGDIFSLSVAETTSTGTLYNTLATSSFYSQLTGNNSGSYAYIFDSAVNGEAYIMNWKNQDASKLSLSASGTLQLYNQELIGASSTQMVVRAGGGQTTDKMLDVRDNSDSSLFSVNPTIVSFNQPMEVAVAGDVGFAYDLEFTNPDAAYIRSQGPLYIEGGDINQSLDLTLKAYNYGEVVVQDSAMRITRATSTVSETYRGLTIDIDDVGTMTGTMYGLDVDFSGVASGTVYSAIFQGGMVGIGNTAPGGTLAITSVSSTLPLLKFTSPDDNLGGSEMLQPSIDFSATGTFRATSTDMSGNSAFVMDTYGAGSNAAVLTLRSNGTDKFIFNSNSTSTLTGNVYITGELQIVGDCTEKNGACADLAETYDSIDDTEPGDVVIVASASTGDAPTIEKSKTAYAGNVAGVVSTSPGITFGQNGGVRIASGSGSARRPAVALAGRVPVKVSLENGEIVAGDLLVSASEEGRAMKYDASKATGNNIAIIGTALENYNGQDDDGKILIMLRSGFVSPNANTSEILTVVEEGGEIVVNNNIFGDVVVQSIVGASGDWSISADGIFISKEMKTKEMEAEGYKVKITEEKKTIGVAEIPQGETTFTVESSAARKSSRIFITFRGNPGGAWWISRQDDGWFEISLGSPAISDVKFDYWIISVLDETAVEEEPADEPPAEEPPAEEPPADEPPADEPPAEEPPADEPPADEPPAEEPPADEPPADEPPAEEPPADEPPVEDTTP
jgi:hypothetical protein